CCACVRVEWSEELVLDPLHRLAQLRELAAAFGRQADHLAAAVVRVAAALDQATLLEPVEQADELAAVDRERVGDRRLRLACALVEERHDAVVVGVEASALELL